MTPWTTAHQASQSFTVSQSLLKLMSIESMMPSNHLILCCPLLLLHSIFYSIRVFSNVSSLHQVAQSIGVSASASVLPMNIQGLFPLGWTGLISLQSKGLSRVFHSTAVQKHQFFGTEQGFEVGFAAQASRGGSHPLGRSAVELVWAPHPSFIWGNSLTGLTIRTQQLCPKIVCLSHS